MNQPEPISMEQVARYIGEEVLEKKLLRDNLAKATEALKQKDNEIKALKKANG